MIKTTETWRISDLLARQHTISFPKYQRESTVWNRAAKQRLLDSMLRQFDIASLYLYQDDTASFQCIDGRQRIAAILSFFGKNDIDDVDNGFPLRISNEIYKDEAFKFRPCQGATYSDLERRETNGDALAAELLATLRDYRVTIVLLSDCRDPAEFNLQFTRLNLGMMLKSEEKLNAMIGDVRELCFGGGELGEHPFLSKIKIPLRRFARQGVAAQILAQAFSWQENGEFTRTRHYDLQRFFKQYRMLDSKEGAWVQTVRDTLDILAEKFATPEILRNKALTVSVVLLALELELEGEEAQAFGQFVEEFVCRLRWQAGKGLDVDASYRYLTDFQKHVTQASVEKPAVTARAKALREGFAAWRSTGGIVGDVEYREENSGSDPAGDCRAALNW